MRLALALILACTSFTTVAAEQVNGIEHKAKIAIIIDDLGYKLREGRRAIALPHAVTLAIIPGSPHALKLAQSANNSKNKEILVHLPMTPSHQRRWEQGLDLSMEQAAFREKAAVLLQSVPYAIGANNHGGSLLTQNRERMDWLMTVLNEHNFFFVDSRTTAQSVVVEAAKLAQVEYGVRDVFLDNIRSEEAIEQQLNKLISQSQKYGQAIAIGHPYTETLNVLESQLPALASMGVELVGISSLLEQEPHNARLAHLSTVERENKGRK